MSERASASIELALGIVALVLPAAIVVLSLAPWLEARSFVRAAAAEGARAAVLATGDPAVSAHRLISELAAARHYREVEVVLCGGGPCRLERGAVITVEVTVEVPLVTTPWGGVGGLNVNGFHAEPVDVYRSLP